MPGKASGFCRKTCQFCYVPYMAIQEIRLVWKEKALGTEKTVDSKGEVFPYKPEFLKSGWKLFHDAIQAHRFAVIHDILPRYGICAA